MVDKLIDEIESYFTTDNYDNERLWQVVNMMEDHGTVVNKSFRQGGRWSNYETTVYAVEVPNDYTRYYELVQEVPATELQDGGDHPWDFNEVYPREKTVIVYE